MYLQLVVPSQMRIKASALDGSPGACGDADARLLWGPHLPGIFFFFHLFKSAEVSGSGRRWWTGPSWPDLRMTCMASAEVPSYCLVLEV